MNVEEKFNLIKRGTEEIITSEELKELIKRKETPSAYWGFECSGLIHLGTGLVAGLKIRDLVNAGFDFIVFLADWHSWINNKFGGDMDKIRLAGEYFKEGFKALGIKGRRVRYVWASELVGERGYWETVVKIAKHTTLNRALRTLPIMGRKETTRINEIAWLIYPMMQAADIFRLKIDVACAGMDQRKVHILAREVSKHLDGKKPILLHTPLLPSLNQPVPKTLREIIVAKMSKSRGEMISIHDPPESIRRKIMSAYCPPESVGDNPIFYVLKQIIFTYFGKLRVEREPRYGGDVTYQSYDEIVEDYLKGNLHPADLKSAVAEKLIEVLHPVRKYFEGKTELLESMIKLTGKQ